MRELKKFRTCNKCRSNLNPRGKYCDLGYKRKSYRINPCDGDYSFIKPLEPCPKPLTNQQLFESPEKKRD